MYEAVSEGGRPNFRHRCFRGQGRSTATKMDISVLEGWLYKEKSRTPM
jgi:hypothetical protein